MIASYKRKTNIASAIFMVALIGPIVLVNVLAWTGHKVLRDMEDTNVLANAIMIALVVPYFYGTWAYLKAKGEQRLGAIGRDVDRDDCHPAAEGPRQGRHAAAAAPGKSRSDSA